MEIIKGKLPVRVRLPKKDFSNHESECQELSVNTEFNPENNSLIFALRIPSYIFDYIKDSDEGYHTEPEKPEHKYESKTKKFVQILRANNLTRLLESFEKICSDCIITKEREVAETEKYIAIKFSQSNLQKRDNFNFASMGFQTTSLFQFFVIYKAVNPSAFNAYIYKSNVRVGTSNHDKHNGWYFIHRNTIEGKFQLIKWTQEREDFLRKVQEKLVAVNTELETYLGNITEDKIMALMVNNQLSLTS